MPRLRVPVREENGVFYAAQQDADDRATRTWSPLATENAVFAAAAAAPDDPFAKYPEWIDEHIRGAEGEFLDAGCGYGRVAIQILKKNAGLRCVGIDASPVMLGKFVQLAAKEGVGERKTLYHGNLQRLPFEDDQFTFVMSCAVLLHLPAGDVRAALTEFRRVLKPGGKLILTDAFPNSLNLEGIQQLPNRLRARANGPVRTYTRGEVRRMLSDFARVEITAHGLVLLPRVVAGKIPLPFGKAIRSVNRRFTRAALPRLRKSPFFVTHHDVVAVK